jgi:hypothetical protein
MGLTEKESRERMRLQAYIKVYKTGKNEWKSRINFYRISVHDFTETFKTERAARQKAVTHLEYERDRFGIGWDYEKLASDQRLDRRPRIVKAVHKVFSWLAVITGKDQGKNDPAH